MNMFCDTTYKECLNIFFINYWYYSMLPLELVIRYGLLEQDCYLEHENFAVEMIPDILTTEICLKKEVKKKQG